MNLFLSLVLLSACGASTALSIGKTTNATLPATDSDYWMDEVTVKGSTSTQLVMANNSLCILSQVYKTTFESCHLYINQAADSNYYWYLDGSGDDVTCSAICSQSGVVSWAVIDNTALRHYEQTIQYGKNKGVLFSYSAETEAKSHCIPSFVQNHVGCRDYCHVYLLYSLWTIDMYTTNTWDSDEQEQNAIDRKCGMVCFDLTKSSSKKTLMAVEVEPSDGITTLTRLDESVCIVDKMEGTGAGSTANCGGGCHLTLTEDSFALQAYAGENAGQYNCEAVCSATCYSL